MRIGIISLILILQFQLYQHFQSVFRGICKCIFHLIGWRLIGIYPHEIPKKIIIVAPHTSAWDVPLGLLVKVWLKMDVQYYVKQEMFRGPLKFILKWTQAIPLDRSGNTNFVDSVVSDFSKAEKRTILITPEGTRKSVKKFKTGFYHIAKGAGIPIVPISFNFTKKEMKVHPTYHIKGEDAEKEIKEVEDIFKGIPGKIKEYSFQG